MNIVYLSKLNSPVASQIGVCIRIGSELEHAGAVRIMCHLSLFRREYFLNTDLINEMVSSQVCQMRSFLVIGKGCADAVDHHHNESAVIHIQPVGAANEFIGAVSYEWAINIVAQVWLVKSSHFLLPTIGEISLSTPIDLNHCGLHSYFEFEKKTFISLIVCEGCSVHKDHSLRIAHRHRELY